MLDKSFSEKNLDDLQRLRIELISQISTCDRDKSVDSSTNILDYLLEPKQQQQTENCQPLQSELKSENGVSKIENQEIPCTINNVSLHPIPNQEESNNNSETTGDNHQLADNHEESESEEDVARVPTYGLVDAEYSTTTFYPGREEIEIEDEDAEHDSTFDFNLEDEISFDLSNLSICDISFSIRLKTPTPKKLSKVTKIPVSEESIQVIEVQKEEIEVKEVKTEVKEIKTKTPKKTEDIDFTKDSFTHFGPFYIDLTKNPSAPSEKPSKPKNPLPKNEKPAKQTKPPTIPESNSKKRKHDNDDQYNLQLKPTNNKKLKPPPQQPIKLAKCPNLTKNLIKNQPETKYWTPQSLASTASSKKWVKTIKIFEGTPEYEIITDHFTKCDNQYDYQIVTVERVENPTLMAAFVLKRQELEDLKPILPVQTKLLFHATKYAATQAIIKDNFDWRKSGESRGHKYGYGTCFTPFSDFATQFGKPSDGNTHYALLCHVLERKSQVGYPDMVLPQLGFDTSHSHNGKVVVKYHDNTAYPAYRITYKRRERYFDDIHMQRNDWYHSYQHSNNYYQFNQVLSQVNYNYFANSWVAPPQQPVNFNYVSYYGNEVRSDNQKKRHRNKRYQPY